ncbi:ABC transporter permease [Streptomyces cavernae]|uniref:ABC transporter permease n=1 Tax=Streptomyces cavernae TaxID=2259034 RepID=UPI000FEBE152|nr:ABC transporter permease [Streptomyces cavernae]
MSDTLTRTTTEAPARKPVPARGSGTKAVLALARFEARELALQIPVVAFLALYLGLTGWSLYKNPDDFPVLHDVDRATQSLPLLLSVMLFVCVNRAVLRSRRRGTDQQFDVLVVEPWRRTVAHALSVVPFAVITALVVLAEVYWAASRPGPAGHPSPAELAVGPLTVLLSGVLGVLLARLVPTVFAAPLFAIAAFVLTGTIMSVSGNPHWLQWLGPVVMEIGAAPLPSDLLGRPAGWHALYLAGLVVLMVCLAVLRSGGRTVPVKAVTALALAATVAGVYGQSPSESEELRAARLEATRHPEKVQSCVDRGTAAYCFFPEWETRVKDWQPVVQGVQSLAGGPAAAARLTVRQRVDARYGLESQGSLEPASEPGQVTVGTRWGGNRIPEFAVGVASVLVAGDEESVLDMCDGRVVTTMWLALRSQPEPMTALRNLRIDDSVKGSAIVLAPTDPLAMSTEQTRIVSELLRRPRYSVIPKVKAHWRELTAPGTTTARVAEILGVPAAPQGTKEDDSCAQ